MNILVIGGGGREHAIVWKLKQSPLCGKVYCLPGNAGISELAECHPEIGACDLDAIVAFAKAHEGRFTRIATKSASILTKLKDGKLVIDKVDGRYFMYWGEYAVHAAVSDNLTDWYPVLNEKGELRKLATPRRGYFDSQMTECGPPAVRTQAGIVLLYNGKNERGLRGDTAYAAGAYCGGQMLFDAKNPYRLIGRLDKPFFVPEAPFERSGQYVHGTVFMEGLVCHGHRLYLYYGCADSRVAVAVCEDMDKLEE